MAKKAKLDFIVEQNEEFIIIHLNGGVNRMLNTANKEQLAANAKEVLSEINYYAGFSKVTVERADILEDAAAWKKSIFDRFAVVLGYNHDRDGIPIPQPGTLHRQ